MYTLLWAAVAVVSLAAPALSAAQSLGDLARTNEERKKRAGASTAPVFDERDVNPALARQEVFA